MNIAKFFNHTFEKGVPSFFLYDKVGNVIYWEFKEGDYTHWQKYKRNKKGQVIHKECSDGFWSKTEYDSDGNETVYTCSDDKYSIQLGD